MKSKYVLKPLAALFCIVPYFISFGQVSTITLPASLYDGTAKVEPVKVGLDFCEGPVADSLGTVYFSEMYKGVVWKVTPEGTARPIRSGIAGVENNKPLVVGENNKPNGLDFNINGELLCCETGKISRMDTSGKVLGFIVWDSTVGPVNDLSIGSKGGMFFTNNRTAFFFRTPEGVIKAYRDFANMGPNGIEWVEEKNLLYLNLALSSKVVVFDVEKDGTVNLASQRDFAAAKGDGCTVDANYNYYVASGPSVKVYSPAGTLLGTITLQGSGISNCVFGGPGNTTLYITTASWGSNTGLHKIKLKVPGRKRPALSVATDKSAAFNRIGYCPGLHFSTSVFNPDKGPLVINFLSGNSSRVDVVFYNLQNREVFRSTSRDDAQRHITWSGRSHNGGLLPSGTYYAAMFANDKRLDAGVFKLVR